MTRYHVGIDCTDSATLGMCTTYLGAVLLERLKLNCAYHPELIRLNPNIPWKTRGNGAVCLRLEGEGGIREDIFRISEQAVTELSVFEDPQTNPGLVVLEGDIPKTVNGFYHRALHEVLDTREALRLAGNSNALFRGWKNKRGLIGALAAVGAELTDTTYEVIVYRSGEDKGPKVVDEASIIKAALEHPSTFFNVSRDGKVLCIPRSPCPVLFGIRGMDPKEALAMASKVEAEGVERWVLWATNQHTDAHIEEIPDVRSIRDHSSIKMVATVSSTPTYERGSHLFFHVRDDGGDPIRCGAYEPTKGFRKALSDLIPGDRIRIFGGVRPSDDHNTRVINLEKVEVLSPAQKVISSNPPCPRCGAKMGSMGSGQPLRCKRCRHIDPSLAILETSVDREIRAGMIEPPEDAWRHLFKPSSLPEVGTIDKSGPYFGNRL